MNPLEDPDSGLWIILSGAFIFLATVVMLYCTYRQWSTPKDLTTASAVVTAYFVSAVSKKVIRNRQAKSKEQS